MEVTTLYLYSKYFIFLRNYGILPYKLTPLDEFKADLGLKRVDFHRSNLFSTIHWLTASIFMTYTAFVTFQFFRRASSGEAGRAELFGLSCWLWKPIFVTGFLIFFHFQKGQLSRFLTKWMETEREVYDPSHSSTGEQYFEDVERLEEIQRAMKGNKRVTLSLIAFWTLVSMALIIVNHLNQMDYPAYLTSYLNNPLDPATFFWLPYFSVIVQTYAVSISILTFTHFHFLCYKFSESIVYALQYISYSAEGGPSILEFGIMSNSVFRIKPTGRLSPAPSDLQNACRKFELLKGLVGQFNGIFRWVFLFYKGILMIQYCILFYVSMRFMALVPFSSVLIFLVSGLHFSVQLALLLPSMAKVNTLSKHFPNAWRQTFPSLTSAQTPEQFYSLSMRAQLLVKCTQFGFEAGGFYVIKSGTILTFFSIATSYLVVLLQL